MSWCKVEAVALKSDLISVVKDLPPPPLIVMSINLKTVPNPKTHHNEVRPMVSVRFQVDRCTVLVVDFDDDFYGFVSVLCRLCPWRLSFITSFLWTRRRHVSRIRPISVVSEEKSVPIQLKMQFY